MKKQIIASLACLCTLLSACQSGEAYRNSSTFSWEDFRTVTITDTLPLPTGYSLSMPFRLLYADSMLFMQSRQPDGFIERYQLPICKLSESLQ